MKRVLLLFGLLASFAAQGFAQMDPLTALKTAKGIWGAQGRIGLSVGVAESGWSYEVGCTDATTKLFTIAGKAPVSWDAAFATVNMTTNGPHTLTATARDTAGNMATSAPVPVYLCNPLVATADVTPHVSVSVADFYRQVQPGGKASFSVVRDGPLTEPLTVAVIFGGAARPAFDYVPVTIIGPPGPTYSTIVFNPGQSTYTYAITALAQAKPWPVFLNFGVLYGSGYLLDRCACANVGIFDWASVH